MQLSAIGLPVGSLDTPALLLDLDRFERNAARMSEHFRARSVAWRPHAKAFKCPAIAHQLRKLGAIGVTVAKVSEAEIMAAGGIDDILIAHIVVGPSKTTRLAALQRHADVKVTVDHIDQVDDLAASARASGVTIGTLVDVDLGMKRCGVPSAAAAAELAGQVSQTRGLRFEGIMGYEGHTLLIVDPAEKRAAIQDAIGRLLEAKCVVEAAGLPCRIVSAGGSGSYQITPDFAGLTEMQAGGGIFACQYYTQACHVSGHEPAIFLLATVVSRPARDRAILDIGRKSVSDYRVSPVLRDYPDCPIVGLSAEHATVEVRSSRFPKIGEKVMVIPGYSDFTFVLHDRVLGYRSDRIEAAWELLGRGKLQ